MQQNSLFNRQLLGYGCCRGHHGEIFQGVIRPEGEKSPQPVLISLPCFYYRSSALFFGTSAALQITPSNKPKALQAARLTLAFLGVPETGRLVIDSNIPAGRGLGSSSADVVAVIRAVAGAFKKTLPPPTIAGLAVQAETATDPLMFEDGGCVLFAQRAGRVIERFSAPLPPLEVLSIQQNSSNADIDTLALTVPEYNSRDIDMFALLLRQFREAMLNGDSARVAEVAGASAHIHQRYLNKPYLEEIERTGKRHGALGIQVAHSGSVMGLLFRKGDREGALSAQRELGERLGDIVELQLLS